MIFIKRLFVVFIAVISLCGCGKNKVALQSEFSLEANAEIDGAPYTAEITLNKNGTLCATVVDPSGLSGLCYTYSGGEGKLSYNGLDLPLPDNPKITSFTSVLAQSLQKCQNGDCITYLGGCPVYESDGYILYFNDEGYPQRLEGGGIVAEFTIK